MREYIESGDRNPQSSFVFTSQRTERLGEAGIHYWFRSLKAKANKDEWDLVGDVTYHDLRHDFAHRARESSWHLKEIAYYLGHTTNRGTPAIQTTARYTQVSREQVKGEAESPQELKLGAWPPASCSPSRSAWRSSGCRRWTRARWSATTRSPRSISLR